MMTAVMISFHVFADRSLSFLDLWLRPEIGGDGSQGYAPREE